MPIGIHWTWNYFEGYVLGTPVSGAAQPGLLLASIHGPDLWTGGAFGPEFHVPPGIWAIFVSDRYTALRAASPPSVATPFGSTRPKILSRSSGPLVAQV
jgi:hypothetical protein